MQRASELELPYLAMDQAWFAEDPFPHFAKARQAHSWLATSPHGFVVTDYFAIRELMRMERHFRMPHRDIVSAMGAEGTLWGKFLVESIQGTSDEIHKRLRDTLAPAFTPREANRQRELMGRVINRLLDQWAPKCRFDFEEFASNFPITVFCEMVGASPNVVPNIRASMEAIGLGFSLDKTLLPALEEAVEVMFRFVEDLVVRRRSGERLSKDRDLLDTLIEAQAGGRMSDAELLNLLIFLFVAGYDTSKNVLTLIMYRMVERPDMYARCAVDKDYCRKVVEETFRFNGVAASPRVVEEDLVYRDILFQKDAIIFFPWSVATRDPAAVENAEIFDPERRQANTHVGFGLGPRICLGRYIALAQLEEGLHLIAQRISNPRITGPLDWRPFPGTWGLKGLPLEFEPTAH